jgi:hypothetical protein
MVVVELCECGMGNILQNVEGSKCREIVGGGRVELRSCTQISSWSVVSYSSMPARNKIWMVVRVGLRAYEHVCCRFLK